MTGISWTNATWNPWAGCDFASPGCTNCYAMFDAYRISKHPTAAPWYRGTVKLVKGKPVWTGQVNRAADHKFNEPLGWRSPRFVFVNSMSDFMLRPEEDRRDAIEIMRRCPQHRFQILTKRAELLHLLPPLPSNVWLGVSVERYDFAWRLDYLRAVDASIRFVSAEPLLGPIEFDLEGIDWVIAGCESSKGKRPGKRPTRIEWVRSIRDQCIAAGVSFWLKQLVIEGKLIELPELDGRVWSERPE